MTSIAVRRIVAIAIAALLLLSMTVVAIAEGGRLRDNAGLLGESEAAALSTTLDSVSETTGLYVGVVTVESIGDEDVGLFADRYYIENDLGSGEGREGIVAFVAMESRDVYIHTYGSRAIATYDDARIDTMLDYLVEDLGAENYYKAFDGFAGNVQLFHEDGIKRDQYTYDTETGAVVETYRPEEPLIDPTWVLVSVAISAAVAALSVAGVVGKYKLIFVPDSYPFREKGSLDLTRREDTFVRKRVTTRVIQTNNGGSGGSRSSVSRSSGGGMRGGGGRKF